MGSCCSSAQPAYTQRRRDSVVPEIPSHCSCGLIVSDAADTPDELRAKWLEFRAYAAAKARGRLGSMSGFRRGFSDSNAVKYTHLQCSSHHFRARFRLLLANSMSLLKNILPMTNGFGNGSSRPLILVLCSLGVQC